MLPLSGEVNPAVADLNHSSCHPGTRLVDEGLVHILSMGSKALMLQVWANLSTGSLTFRWFCCGLKNIWPVHGLENSKIVFSSSGCARTPMMKSRLGCWRRPTRATSCYDPASGSTSASRTRSSRRARKMSMAVLSFGSAASGEGMPHISNSQINAPLEPSMWWLYISFT